MPASNVVEGIEGDRLAVRHLIAAGHRGDALVFVRRRELTSTSGSSIPADGAVLAAYGARTNSAGERTVGNALLVLRRRLPRGASRNEP